MTLLYVSVVLRDAFVVTGVTYDKSLCLFPVFCESKKTLNQLHHRKLGLDLTNKNVHFMTLFPSFMVFYLCNNYKIK